MCRLINVADLKIQWFRKDTEVNDVTYVSGGGRASSDEALRSAQEVRNAHLLMLQ